MIIDCHCHAGKGDGFHGPWDTEARIEPHLKRARQVLIRQLSFLYLIAITPQQMPAWHALFALIPMS